MITSTKVQQSSIIEIWKPVKGFDTYEISCLGNVRSIDRWVKNWGNHKKWVKGKTLKSHISKTGYYVVDLVQDGKRKTYKLHRLLALHFLPNPEGKKFINHIDSNRLNNSLSNLEWVSNRENGTHRWLNTKTSSKYTGVSWHKNQKMWVSSIARNGKNIYLGRYDSEIEAYKAYLQYCKNHNIQNKYA